MVSKLDYVIDQKLVTGNYCSGMDRLYHASHFVDRSGDKFKIPQGLKVYYNYRYKQYHKFYDLGLPYFESIKTASKVLSISEDSIKKTYHPLLKRMNLLETFDTNTKETGHYKFNPLDEVTYNGWLINPDLQDTKQSKKKDKQGIDWQQLKTLEHNQSIAKRAKSTKDKVLTLIPREEYFELLEIKRIAEEH
ncbi:hypothetical protein NVP1170O_115 [Vibrio phage 1.170.O._10N.261.52.C3]|nr:hypothetical protein NVP1170O_115 [Vibrio phage 1.170.O._10N.261.52.C3]